MSNLREMIDGVGSLELDVSPVERNTQFRPQDQAVLRRQLGEKSSEVLVGTILAMQGNTATFVVRRQSGLQKMTVNVKDLAPVTESFRRQSIQFSPAGKYRGRV